MPGQPSSPEPAGSSHHSLALAQLDRNVMRLLALRGAVQWITLWCFVWGVVVLAVRISGLHQTEWLALGLFGIVPLIFFSLFRAAKQKPGFNKLRASYDRLNECGGVMMSQEVADMSAWQSQLSAAAPLKLRWHSGRPLLLLAVSALFAATALLLPERLAHFGQKKTLEIGQIVEQLQAEVKTLAQEKILDGQKAEDLQKQLAQLQKNSSGFDPGKTWEALDHIKQSDADLAKQAAEEALKKTADLTEAETLAKAMQQAAESGMSEATASTAAKDLASLLNAAKLEEGIFNGKIPPELLEGLSGLDKEQMEKLAKALAANKNSLNTTMSNLANLKMIDAATLAKMQQAGKADPAGLAGLADYLSKCEGGKCEALFSWLRKCKGGPGGGGPEAEMSWDNNTSEDNQKFQEHTLPPSPHLSDAQLVGVSKSAPELNNHDLALANGALANAVAGGGSAHSQVVLPEQRQAVQNFFKRDEK